MTTNQKEQIVMERHYRLDAIAWSLNRDEVWTQAQTTAEAENSEADTDNYLTR